MAAGFGYRIDQTGTNAGAKRLSFTVRYTLYIGNIRLLNHKHLYVNYLMR